MGRGVHVAVVISNIAFHRNTGAVSKRIFDNDGELIPGEFNRRIKRDGKVAQHICGSAGSGRQPGEAKAAVRHIDFIGSAAP